MEELGRLQARVLDHGAGREMDQETRAKQRM